MLSTTSPPSPRASSGQSCLKVRSDPRSNPMTTGVTIAAVAARAIARRTEPLTGSPT